MGSNVPIFLSIVNKFHHFITNFDRPTSIIAFGGKMKIVIFLNVAKIKKLARIAPWMNLCKCQAAECIKEVDDYETVHGPLRNQPRVVIVEDKVIIRLLMNTVKKLSDYFDTDDSLLYD